MRAWMLAVMWGAACAQAPAAVSNVAPAPVVQVAPANAAVEGEARVLYGVTAPADELVASFAVGGRIATLPADVGDAVRQGQVLATLDARPLRRRVEALQATAARVQLSLQQADRDLARLTTLAGTQSVSTQQLEQAQTQRDALAAQADEVAASLGEARWALEQSSLRAPFDGVVSRRLQEPGQVVSAGSPVVELGGQGVDLTLSAPARVLHHLALGDVLPVQVGGRTHEGSVLAIAATPGMTGLFGVRVRLPSGEGVLPGASARARWTEPAPEGSVVVPNAAVLAPDGHDPHVVRVAEGRTEAVPVELITLTERGVLLRGAIGAGDELVVLGHAGLVDGTLVEVSR